MHTRASRRRAARCAEQAPPSPLLLQLPAPAQRLVVSAVQEHDGLSSMRLANKAIKQLVDESATHLSLKQLIAMREDDLRRVRSTFPSLTSLCLSSADEYLTTSQQQAAAAAAANKAAALLVGSQPWPAIRTLALWDMPDEATELMVQHCPNVLEYKACSEDSSYSLGEPALRALAPCAALTQLEIDMFQPSDGVLEALLSLRGLTSLHVWFCLSDAPLPEMAWDLRGMAGLHTLDMVSKYPQALEGDELYDEEQRQLRNLEQQAYGTMRLPASLRELRALLMPAAPLPPLRLLELQHAAATDSTLLKLAVACPTLEQLDVFSLDITMAAHAAPLQAVTSLNVWHDVRATACARLAAVFPSLRELALNSASDAFGYSTQCLDGAVALSKFMVCHADGDGKGISMPRATFDLLAALPKLTILCLDAEHVHVEGVQLLTQLTRISWTVHGQGTDMLEELGAAFMAALHHMA